ncbi:MAG TPA: YkvA family protein [Candidatus Binatia bacterium]|nr:YkvA family protein [Candidatus Binatia bacterium]
MKSGRIESWRRKATQLKTEVYALYFAARDPRVPWYAKLFAGCVVAYALSPIDLIPDFIPVLGYLDDFVLLPLGIALTLQMIPPVVLVECREKGRAARDKPKSWLGAIIIVSIWILLSAIVISITAKHFC